MVRRIALLLGVVALVQPAPMFAQSAPDQTGQPTSPLEQLERRFMTTAPELGEPLPDLTIVDRDGNPVNLRETAREHWTACPLSRLLAARLQTGRRSGGPPVTLRVGQQA